MVKMSVTGLLILSNVKNFKSTLNALQKYVNNLYIHVNIPKSTEYDKLPPPAWCNLISKIYLDCVNTNSNIDIRFLVNPLKNLVKTQESKNIQLLFSDQNNPEICEHVKDLYKINVQPIILNDENEIDLGNFIQHNNLCVYKNVVLGGTFDRIHIGHKILLTEAVLRATKKVIVGVTNEKMIQSKKLHELILPTEKRIDDVKKFLNDIDFSLEYEIVSIDDPFGPTKTDPNMDMIIVTSETLRGGQKVNEIRAENGLKSLEICCIDVIESREEDGHNNKENKISSSNKRMDLLGTRIRAPEIRPNLPNKPYIIGLTGIIASGKSKMAQYFASFGAEIINCDKIAHEIYEPGKICYQKIIDHFGSNILNSCKKINRAELGKIVFSNPKELDILNQILWPEILLEVKRRIANISDNKVVIIEAAVLFQANWENECHEIWSVIVSPAEAVRRIQERNNLSENDAKKRIATQLDNKTIVSKSNIIFSTNWNYDYTQYQAEKAWKIIMNEIHLIN